MNEEMTEAYFDEACKYLKLHDPYDAEPHRFASTQDNGAYPTVSGGGQCIIWFGAEKERLVAITGLVLVMIVAVSRVAHYFDVSIQSSLLNLC